MVHPEIIRLVARLVPGIKTLRLLQLANTSFRLSPEQQYDIRITFRTPDIERYFYKLKLSNNHFDGICLSFHDPEKYYLRSVKYFIDGDRHGPGRSWHKNGCLKIQTSYERGEQNGTTRTWHKSGYLEEQCDKVAGKIHGQCIRWYDGGQMRSQCEYRHDIPHGTHIYWYDNGQPRKYCEYVDGEHCGDYKQWAVDGTLIEYIIYDYKVILARTNAVHVSE